MERFVNDWGCLEVLWLSRCPGLVLAVGFLDQGMGISAIDQTMARSWRWEKGVHAIRARCV